MSETDHSSSFTHPQSLLDAFRTNYHRIERAVHEIVTVQSDTTVIARLGDDLDEFLSLVIEVSQLLPFGSFKLSDASCSQNGHLFEPIELHTLRTNLSHMQTDMRLQYQDILDESHHG